MKGSYVWRHHLKTQLYFWEQRCVKYGYVMRNFNPTTDEPNKITIS